MSTTLRNWLNTRYATIRESSEIFHLQRHETTAKQIWYFFFLSSTTIDSKLRCEFLTGGDFSRENLEEARLVR